jgi:hypothetical protein
VRTRLDRYEQLFVVTAFVLQLALLVYFVVRKHNFELAIKWGWVIYALAMPAFVVSIIMILGGKDWSFWLGGLLFLAWSILGYIIDIARPVSWRSPIYLPVFIPFVVLYLGAQMLYWFPVGMIQRVYWYIYAVLFIASTYFNVTSHQ